MFVTYNSDTGNFGVYPTREQAGAKGYPVYSSPAELVRTPAPVEHMTRFYNIRAKAHMELEKRISKFGSKEEAAQAIWNVLQDLSLPAPPPPPVAKFAKLASSDKKRNLNSQTVINAKVKAMKEAGFLLAYNRGSRAWSIQKDGKFLGSMSSQEFSTLDESGLVAFARSIE